MVDCLTPEEFESVSARLDADAQRRELSHQALLRLVDFYRGLGADRRVVDKVLGSWPIEGNVRKRFDALALIEEFQIRSALPLVRMDLARLGDAVGPSVPSDREKLVRILSRLGAGDEGA